MSESLRKGANLKIREASESDMLLVYNWNNDPLVRKNSFNPEPIPLDNHAHWFQNRLEDNNCKIYIIELNDVPAAQIRFNLEGEVATISYLVAREFRGKGLGSKVLTKGVERIKADYRMLNLVEGLVQYENIASIRAFEKSGFIYGEQNPQQPKAHRFVMLLSV